MLFISNKEVIKRETDLAEQKWLGNGKAHTETETLSGRWGIMKWRRTLALGWSS